MGGGGSPSERETIMKVVVSKEMTFSSGRHHVIQASQFPAYFAKRKMNEHRIWVTNSKNKITKLDQVNCAKFK